MNLNYLYLAFNMNLYYNIGMARVLKNIIGKKFDFLTIIKQTSTKGKVKVLCRCICGAEIEVFYSQLQDGIYKSCGKCFSNAEVAKFMDSIKAFARVYCSKIVGRRYGRLVVLKKVGDNKVECICDCGNKVIVQISNLHNKLTTSCGCYRDERIKEVHTTHGLSNTRLYYIWKGMKDRCYREDSKVYQWYGAKGIGICEEWLNNFEKFRKWSLENGYKEDLSIDRIDAFGNYEPNNCRWATLEEQANNKRNTKFLEYKGIKKSVAQWGKEFGISSNTLNMRLNKGWDIEKALSTPVRKKRRLP